jgi:hypothetical protein
VVDAACRDPALARKSDRQCLYRIRHSPRATTTRGIRGHCGDDVAHPIRRKEDGYYHIDIPFAIDTQRALLLEAGFRDFDVIWQEDPTEVLNAAVYVVTA